MDERGTRSGTDEAAGRTEDAARTGPEGDDSAERTSGVDRRAGVDAAADAEGASGTDRAAADVDAAAGRAARRLERAPGERYRGPATVAEEAATAAAGTGSAARAAGFAAPAALIALAVYVAFAGPLAFSAGLVIIGIFAGRIIGLSAKVGAARSIPSDQVVVVALVATLAWFALAQVGTWIFARNEGGVLPIIDYLLETFGPVVPLVAIASILAAWWSAR